MKIKSKNSLLMFILIPALASAAGIGKINVTSALGEPLKAEVEVFVSDSNELDLAVARMGSMQDYADAGIADSYVSGVDANIIKKSNGRYAIELHGNQAVNEPYLELLVKLDTKTSNLMRQYTVLLDPPMSTLHEEFTPDSHGNIDTAVKKNISKKNKQIASIKDEQTKDEQSSELEATRQGNSAGLASPSVSNSQEITKAKTHQPDPSRVTASDETYVAQNGDVFGKIAQRYQPVGVPLVKVMAAFYALNKSAFIDGDMHRLKSGSVIRIPDQESLNNAGHLKATHAAKAEAPEPTRSTESKEPVSEDLKSPANAFSQAPKPPVKEMPKAEPTRPLDENVSQNPTKGDPNYVLKVSPGDTSVTVSQPTPSPSSDLSHASKDGNGQTVNSDGNDVHASKNENTAQANAKPSQNNGLATAANKNSESSSFTETLQSYWTSILTGLGLLLVAFLAWLGYNKQRQATKDLRSHFSPVFGEEILPIEPPIPETTLSNNESNKSNTYQQTNVERRTEPSVSDTLMGEDDLDKTLASENAKTSEPVDPLIEAELYMTYGRHKQAETILTSVDTPYKLELSLGLLKIYADRKDKVAFERIVHSIHDDLASGSIEDAMIWSKVVALGAKIDPENPLYGGASKVNKLSARERAAAAEKAMRDNLMPFEPNAPMNFPDTDTALEQFTKGTSQQEETSPKAMEDHPSEISAINEPVVEEFEKIEVPEKSNEIEFTLEDLKLPELSVKVSEPDMETGENEPEAEKADTEELFSKLKDSSKLNDEK